MNDLTYTEKKFIDYTTQIVTSNKLSHSYLIELDNYDDNLSFVYSFIKQILCPLKSNDYSKLNCGQCNICKLIDENNYPDLEVIEATGSWIKKGQLLDLKSEYQNKSLLDNCRIYIIKEADKLNPAAANTILKFLEEPEDGIIAFLLTSNRYNVLDTILSRCQILSLKNNLVSFAIENKLVDFIRFLVDGESLFINYKIIYETILTDKDQAKSILLEVENLFIAYLDYKNFGDKASYDERFSFLESCKLQDILTYISIIEEELPKLLYNINYKLWLDVIFSRFVEVR